MNEKTVYLQSLEKLKSIVKEKVIRDDLQTRLDMLSRIVYAHSILCLFQSAKENAEEKISFLEFHDIDFSIWTNINNWKIEEALYFDDKNKIEQYLNQNWLPAMPKLTPTDFNSIAGTLPSPPKNIEFNDANGRDIMRQILSNLSGNYFSAGFLRYALLLTIQHICDTLHDLQYTLKKDRSDKDYLQLHDKLWFSYSTAHSKEISDNYFLMKSNRCGAITQDWLQEKLQGELTKLYNSTFFTYLMKEVTFTESQNTTILYELDNVDKRNTKKFYFMLTQVGAVFENKIDFSSCGAELGRFICNSQDQFTKSEHEAFFYFRMISNFILVDMKQFSTPVPKPKRTPKAAPQVDKNYMTFAMNGINSGHITLLYQHLMDINWIDKSTQPDDFQRLFSAKNCVCKITWTGGGKGNLKFLFQKMLEQKKISIPGNFGLVPILEAHFVDKEGIYLTELNKGKVSKKALPIIKGCIDILNTSARVDD